MPETLDAMPPHMDPDPATLAFEMLREEVALVRRAVAGLSAERASIEIPDYTETLGQIMRASAATAQSVKILTEMPATRLSARDWGRQIAAAAEEARRVDRQAFANAQHKLERIVDDMAGHLRSARLAGRQRQSLIFTAAGGIAAGMLLFTIMIDLIVRLVPGSWLWPERLAASILRMDEETAGVHLIKTAAPDRWRDIVAGYTVLADNRAAIAQCERNGAKSAGAIQCVIELRK